MTTDAQKRAFSRYNQRSINISVCYRPSESADGKRLKQYLSDSNQSANSYIKGLIKADLDAKGIEYPDES